MLRNMQVLIALGFLSFVLLGVPTAEAEQYQDKGQQENWSVRLGALGILTPEYEGSDDYELQGFPLIDISWRDKIFFNPRNGLGAYYLQNNGLKLGASIGYAFGRDEGDSSELAGLGDIDGGATANLLFGWELDDFSLSARYEQQFTGNSTGFQVHAGLGYSLRLGEKTLLKPALKTTYSSADYMEEYFSVSPSQAVRSGLPVYPAGAGFKSLGLQLLALYRLDGNWGLQVLAGVDRLLGDTADSPVVKDENQFLLGLGLSYSF